MCFVKDAALAVDRDVWTGIEANLTERHSVKKAKTPDNEYMIIRWEDYCGELEGSDIEFASKRVENIRHAMVVISDEGINSSIKVSDENGIDEDFYDILGWDANIYLWGESLL